jgi:hypothetical protein
MLSQIIWKLEKTATQLEIMSDKAKKIIIKEITKKPEKGIKDSINRFFEFFVITPVSLDPYGIIKKLDHIIREQRNRFKYFVNQMAPGINEEKKACIQMGIAAGISVHEIAKIVRHYVELIKKTKSIQIAMILQMQMPLIERVAKAMFSGTKTLTKGNPIGDGLGPLVVANLIGNKKVKDIEEEMIMAKIKMDNRELFILKSKGPGGRVGRPDKAVERIINKNKISRIITVDAAVKLEGERTGSVAEGVGVAMGGIGVERSYIEEIAMKKNIPLDSIVVKMSQEEAIMPMRKTIKDSVSSVKESIKRSLMRTKPKDKIILVGVGNTSGIGNSARDAKKVEKWVNAYEKKLRKKRKRK